MKNVTILSTYSLDEPVLRNRITPFIDLALERGFLVTLVNPEGGEYHQSNHTGYTHKAVDAPQANRGNFIVRTLREIFLARKILKSVPDDIDVILVTIPSMFLLFLFKRSFERKSVLDVRDITWEYLSESSFLIRIAKNIFQSFARKKVLNFDFFSVTNNAEKKYLNERLGVSLDLIELCPNGISKEQFKEVSSIKENYKLTGKNRFVVSYVGNVGVAQNLMTLVSTARLLPNVSFFVVGKGSDFDRVEKASYGCTNVNFLGRLSWDEIPKIYEESDILWAQLTPDFSGAVPSKLYEYLATGKPVIYGGFGEAVNVFSEFENLHFIEPNNSNMLASKIEKLKSSSSCARLSHSNREKIKDGYIREEAVERLYKNIFNG